MILKQQDKTEGGDALLAAGQRAERQMAFYLQRAFGDTPDVLVINDLRVVLDEGGDAAQMDHLIVHRYGMVIIESKSVTSKVKINAQGEWIRWWNGRWKGMASPVLQAQRQAEALRGLLQRFRESLRERKLFGLIQGGFKFCPIDTFVAISDEGMLDEQSERPPGVLKADAVAGEVRQLIERHRKGASFFAGMNSKPNEGAYFLTDGEMDRVTRFLIARHVPRTTEETREAETSDKLASSAPREAARALSEAPMRGSASGGSEAVISTDRAVVCKHCGHSEGEAQWGKFGYYLRCRSCGKNTALDKRCAACGKEARIRKEGANFWRECRAADGGCGAAVLVWTNRT